jgi:hypothetical protein
VMISRCQEISLHEALSAFAESMYSGETG